MYEYIHTVLVQQREREGEDLKELKEFLYIL